MLVSYLDQLEREANEAGIDLASACKDSSVAMTTLQRWRRGETFPSEAAAKKISDAIHAKKRAAA